MPQSGDGIIHPGTPKIRILRGNVIKIDSHMLLSFMLFALHTKHAGQVAKHDRTSPPELVLALLLLGYGPACRADI